MNITTVYIKQTYKLLYTKWCFNVWLKNEIKCVHSKKYVKSCMCIFTILRDRSRICLLFHIPL